MVLDRSIPFFNMFMRCNVVRPVSIKLSDGYTFCSYRSGFVKTWAELECALGDFASEDEAVCYFKHTYLAHEDALKKRGVFVVDACGQLVGSCMAWYDQRGTKEVASVHWLVVAQEHQGKGIGRAICQQVMAIFKAYDELPIYIHTQPWSWKAILLYASLGFRLQKEDTFSNYVNQYDEGMAVLKTQLTDAQYAALEKGAQI